MRSGKGTLPLPNELIEQPAKGLRLARCSAHVNQGRQRVQQKLAGRDAQLDFAANHEKLIAFAMMDHVADTTFEDIGEIGALGVQVGAEDM